MAADRFVPGSWQGRTAVCIASGPSLVQEDVDRIPSNVKVIAVNDAVRIVPRADVLYSSDAAWWMKAIKRKVAPADVLWMSIKQHRRASALGFPDPRIVMFHNSGESGFDPDPRTLRTMDNSGGCAIQVAAKFGATRIVLLGYDMSLSKDQYKHFHDENRSSGSPYAKFRSLIGTLVEPLKSRGIDVINCSRRTALKCFPTMDLESAMASVPRGTVAA